MSNHKLIHDLSISSLSDTLKEALVEESNLYREKRMRLNERLGVEGGVVYGEQESSDFEDGLFRETSRLREMNREELPLSRAENRSSAPVRPVKSMWRFEDEPPRFVREYDFIDAPDLAEFIKLISSSQKEVAQLSSVDIAATLSLAGIDLAVEVSKGGFPVGEDERFLTQVLDELYEGADEQSGPSNVHLDDADDYDWDL